jgi:hypothetical protein
MSSGDYYRASLHQERARRQSILVQRSRNGRPRYLETADLTDWARIMRKQVQRLAQLGVDGVHGASAWRLEVLADDNNFTILGGDNTDEGAKAAWVGGLRALLYRNTDYQCLSRGPFNETDAFALHHRATGLGVGTLTDSHAKMVVNALVGMSVQIPGAGSFPITANTATQLSLDGFDPADYPELGARPYYFVELQAPEADATQPVYLDVHIEDWGMAEDPALDHNPGGTPVECARREVLIQRVWVQQVADAPEMPVSLTYLDSTGTRHWVLKIGEIVRVAGEDGIDAVNADARNEHASVAEEVEEARSLAFACVDAPFDDLADRLMRDTSVIVVGNSDASNAYRGHFNGPEGLLAALACDAAGARTIFLRNGTYSLVGLGKLTVRANWTIIGESPAAAVYLDADSVGESMLVSRHARVANISIVRNNAAGRDVAVRLGGRGAALDRCFVYDLKVGGTAVLLQGSGATGGASLVDCDVYKVNGSGVRFAEASAEPPLSQGGTAIGTEDTHLVGSLPALGGDAGTVDVSTYGCSIARSRVMTVCSEFDADDAGIYVGAGDSVHISQCAVLSDGGAAMTVKTKLAGGGAPSSWSARGATTIDGSVFMIQPGDNYADAAAFAVKYTSGRIDVRGCRVEALEPGTCPPRMVKVDPSAEMLDLTVDGLLVRTQSAQAVSVEPSVVSAARARLAHVDVVPMGDAVGPTTGFSLNEGSPRSLIEAVDCRVTAWSAQQVGFYVIGGVTLRACVVDGADTAQRALAAGDLPLVKPAAFSARLDADGTRAPVLESCHVLSHGCVGFRVDSPVDNALRVVLRNCVVAGRSRTLAGMACLTRGRVSIVGGEIYDVRGAGVLNATDRADAVICSGLQVYRAGQEYVVDSSFPSEGDDFQVEWAAGLRGTHLASQCLVNECAVGIRPAANGVVNGGVVSACLVGVQVEEDGTRLDGVELADCTYGLVAHGVVDGPVGSASIYAPKVAGAKITSVAHTALTLKIVLSQKGSMGLHMDAVGANEPGGWSVGVDITGPSRHNGRPIFLNNCVGGSLSADVRVSRAQPVTVSGCTRLDIAALRSDTSPALLADGADGIRVRNVYSRDRVVLKNCPAGVVVDGGEVEGLTVTMEDPPAPYSQVLIKRLHALGTSSGDTADVASGIYIGREAGVRLSALDLVIEDCKVGPCRRVRQDLTAPVAEVEVGRSAGIRVQAGGTSTRVQMLGCTILGDNVNNEIGALLGDLNQIVNRREDDTDDQHCYGIGRLEVKDCVFQTRLVGGTHPPLLVAVMQTTVHTVHGNHFAVDMGRVAYFYAECNGDPDLYVRVDFKGNTSTARSAGADGADRPVIMYNQRMLLDGGLTPGEWGGLPNAPGDHELEAVLRTNNVWSTRDWMLDDTGVVVEG